MKSGIRSTTTPLFCAVVRLSFCYRFHRTMNTTCPGRRMGSHRSNEKIQGSCETTRGIRDCRPTASPVAAFWTKMRCGGWKRGPAKHFLFYTREENTRRREVVSAVQREGWQHAGIAARGEGTFDLGFDFLSHVEKG